VNKEDMTVDESKLQVVWDDFEVALTEVHPKFGAPTADLEAFFANGIVQYGEAFAEVERRLAAAVRRALARALGG
jgi:vesicle-fusing ATPase